MAVVKGSKQFRMVVVRSRPVMKIFIALVCLAGVALLVYGSHFLGKEEGLALKVSVVQEKEQLQSQLSSTSKMVASLRQKIADITVGEEIDLKANEEVRLTVESLQQEIAALREEVRFYKSVLMPNGDEKGLRIERLELKTTADPRKARYNLLLTQVVDKHNFIQGNVEMYVVGTRSNEEVSIPFSELEVTKKEQYGFKFRYFQNYEGELAVPEDLIPIEIRVIAKANGKNGRRLERMFDWKLAEG